MIQLGNRHHHYSIETYFPSDLFFYLILLDEVLDLPVLHSFLLNFFLLQGHLLILFFEFLYFADPQTLTNSRDAGKLLVYSKKITIFQSKFKVPV